MDQIVDNSNLAIARRIRVERETRGWSQTELAHHSEVSKATIGKIERGDVSPTASILVRIAGAFDLTLAGLLVRAEQGDGRIVRSGDQHDWQDPGSGYRRRQLFRLADNPIEMVRIDLPAHTKVTVPGTKVATVRQALWVIEGTLTLAEANETHTLEKGDAYGFGSPGTVTFANQTGDLCTYLVTVARN